MMAVRAGIRRRVLAAAAVLGTVLLVPNCALAQARGFNGGMGGRGFGGGGFGGGGIGLGIGGALIGGAIGAMSRERAPSRDEVEGAAEPAAPRRVRQHPSRVLDETAPKRPKRIAEPGSRPAKPTRPAEPKAKLAKPIKPPPVVKTAKAPPARPPRIAPAPPAAGAAVPVAEAPGLVPGEVLIELKPGAPAGTLARLARRQRLAIVASESFTLVPVTLHRARIRDGRRVAAAIRTLQAEPQVASVQANHVYALVGEAAAPLPLAGLQYAVGKLHLDEAHAVATGRDVTVAVIDSGVDPAHPALAGALAGSWDAIAKAEAAPGTAHAHGTAVAGIVGARAQLASAAPEARLLAIRAFTGVSEKPGAQGTTIHVLRAVDRAAASGARVVNMSFAGPADAKLSQFLAAGTDKGIVYVAAAGNAGPKAPPLYPAADPNVIAVTATDAEDRLFGGANRGPYIAVAAPGVDVYVAAPGSGYGFSTGTSMAAPQVAGIVAVLLQAKPGLTPSALREALRKSAHDLGPPGPDPDYGAGSADARGALQAIGAMPAPALVGDAKPEVSVVTETAKVEPIASEPPESAPSGSTEGMVGPSLSGSHADGVPAQ